MPSVSDEIPQEWRPLEAAPRYLRRNAARTMGGSVVRGLVELITNARDSAYRMLVRGELSAVSLGERPVEVSLIVGSGGKRLSVRDRFEGMTDADMRQRLLKYGASASGYETGGYVRGINARGAKDVGVLGHLKFESIRDGMYAECEVYSGRVRGPSARSCTNADRERMQIEHGNGTVVTLIPDDGVSFAGFDALARDLDHHIEIRYRPESQPRVPIRFQESRERRRGLERDIVGFQPLGELMVEQDIPLVEFTRYGGGSGRLMLYRSTDSLAPLAGRGSMSRLWKSEAGIMVTDGRTAHDITFFMARGSDDTAARYLFGELQLPQITGLLTEFERIEAERDAGADVPFDELNPYQVTDPDRLGLNREHPFVQAVEERVRPLIENVLRELQEELAPSAQERVGAELRSALDRLGEQLAERLAVGGTGPERGHQVRWGLTALPAGVRLELDQTKRISVYYRVEPTTAPESVECQVASGTDAVEVSAGLITLAPVSDQPGVFRGAFDVTGRRLIDLAPVDISAEDKIAVVKASVREPVVGTVQLDHDLQFSQKQYSSLPDRRKKIEIFGDPVLTDRDVEVSLTTGAVALSDNVVRLRFDEDRGIAVGVVYAESGIPASDRIVGRCGELNDEAGILFQDFSARPKIDFKFTDAENFAGRRFRWDPQNNNRVLIAGGHRTVARVLGPIQGESGDQSWPGQSLPQTRAILAELIADAFVYRKLQEAAPMLGIETGNLVDPVDYDNLRYQYFEEAYPLCHEALTPAFDA